MDFFTSFNDPPPPMHPAGTWRGDLDEAAQLWDSTGKGIVPNAVGKLMAGLTLLDMPRRSVWRGARFLTDPIFEWLGVEHPEDFESGFEIGREVANALGEKSGAFDIDPLPEDKNSPIHPEWWSHLGKYALKTAPVYLSQALGVGTDIVMDPLTMLTMKKAPLARVIENEALKPYVPANFKNVDINPTLVRRFSEVTPENIPEVVKTYLINQRGQRLVDSLMRARQDAFTIESPTQRKTALDLIDMKVKEAQNTASYITSKDFQQMFDNLILTVKNNPQHPPINPPKPIPPNDLTENFLRKLPDDKAFQDPIYLAQEFTRLEKLLQDNQPGIRIHPIGFNEPIMTIPGTPTLLRGISKAIKEGKNLFSKITTGHPLYESIEQLSQPLPEEIRLSLKKINSDLAGRIFTIGDLETYLNSIQDVPGGIRTIAQARDWASRIGGRSNIKKVWDSLAPAYKYLESLAESDREAGHAGRRLTSYTLDDLAAVKRGWNEAIQEENQRLSDVFQHPLPTLMEHGITIENLIANNKRRIYQWTKRQVLEHNIDADLLKAFGANPVWVDRAVDLKNKIRAKNQTLGHRINNILTPAVDQMAKIQSVDDIINESNLLMQKRIEEFKRISDPVEAAKKAAQLQIELSPITQNYEKIVGLVGKMLEYSPPPWWDIADHATQLYELTRHLDDFSKTTQDLHRAMFKWVEDLDGKKIFDLLFINSGKVRDTWLEAVKNWDTNNPLTAKQFRAGILQKLGPYAKEYKPAVDKFVNHAMSLGKAARTDYILTLHRLESMMGDLKEINRTFTMSLLPLASLVSENTPLIRPVYEKFILGSLDSFIQAREIVRNPRPSSIPDKFRVWGDFQEKYNEAARSILRPFGVEPEVFDMVDFRQRRKDFLYAHVSETINEEVTKFYDSLFKGTGIDPDPWRKQNLDVLLTSFYQYKSVEKKAAAFKVIAEMLGSTQAADRAIARFIQFAQSKMRHVGFMDREIGVPVLYRPEYLPFMVKDANFSERRKLFGLLPKYFQLKKNDKFLTARWPTLVSQGHINSKHRYFETLDEFEGFLEWAGRELGSANPFNIVAPRKFEPVLSFQYLLTQRYMNHHMAENTIGLLKDLQLKFPHLVKIRGSNPEIDILFENVSSDLFVPEGILGQEYAKMSPELTPGEKWDIRKDFADFLRTYIPKEFDQAASAPELLLNYLSNLHFRFQLTNTTYNGMGHVKNILGLYLLAAGPEGFGNMYKNVKEYGFDVRKWPLYAEAAEVGALPYAGIAHNRPLQEIVNIYLGQPDARNLEQVITAPTAESFGSSKRLHTPFGSIPKELKWGENTILRIPEVGPKQILGFAAHIREPEMMRYLTWEMADKWSRMTLYRQAKEMGFSALDAAKMVRNALVDYQMSNTSARTKMFGNIIFPFFPWWIGNLQIHIPQMLTEPRFYVVANHIMNMLNWYASGNFRDDNPAGFTNAIALPVDGAGDMLYWQLGMPWESLQNKLFRRLYTIWTSPETQSTDPLDILARIENSSKALAMYISSRMTALPSKFLEQLLGAKYERFDPREAAKEFQSDNDFYNWINALVQSGFWGLYPIYAPVQEKIFHPENDPGNTWLLRSILSQFGPVVRMRPSGEKADY